VLAEDRSDERAYNSIVVSRRNSFLNDLFTLATRMHWLAALATAGALYVLLNYFAQRWGTGRLAGATLMQGGCRHPLNLSFLTLAPTPLPEHVNDFETRGAIYLTDRG
jgi:hypothetical protein